MPTVRPDTLQADADLLETAANGRWLSIDILRAAAILWVVVFHLWADMGGSWAVLYGGFPERLTGGGPHALSGIGELVASCGYQGVVVFMMLSGLALTVNAERRGAASLSWHATMTRVRKLLIPYWGAVLLLLITISAIAVLQAPLHDESLRDAWFHVRIAKHVPVNVRLDDILWAMSVAGWAVRQKALTLPVGSLWFVQLLLQYYLVFPLAYRALKNSGPVIFLIAALAITLGARALLFSPLLAGMDAPHRSRAMLLFGGFRFAEFALGMVLGLLIATDGAAIRRVLRPWWSVAALLAAALLAEVVSRAYLLDPQYGGWVLARPADWRAVFGDPMVALAIFTLVAVWIAHVQISRSPHFLVRSFASIGAVSFTVLIANDNVRYIASLLRIEEIPLAYWWLFLTLFYVPASVLLAFPLARLLGLTAREP